MQRRYLSWEKVVSALATFLILATGAGSAQPGLPDAKIDQPQPLPEDIVAAWKAAGAKVGWMRGVPAFSMEFLFEDTEFVREKEGKPGDLPAFRFYSWQEGRLAKLPVPAAAFGLDLHGTEVTDAGLKELAGLKSFKR